jgi:hypothetical protein
MTGFFTWNLRNETGVIQGAEQFGLFTLAVIAAQILTFLVSSVLNHSKMRGDGISCDGIDIYKDATFYQVLQQTLRRKR